MTKSQKYSESLTSFAAILEGEHDETSVMANVAAFLKDTFGFFWVGFYIVRGDRLHLGPFQGPVACYSIAYGKGVCGTAWKEKRTIVVPDVEEFPGHIACSSLSRSEIVVPIFRGTEVVAVLDIDSTQLSTFDSTDQEYLEKMCRLISSAEYRVQSSGVFHPDSQSAPCTHHPAPQLNPICAIATSQGGAIGIIRISGKDTISIVDTIFTSPTNKPLSTALPNTCHYGTISDSSGNLIDEVIVNIYHAPHSYTGEDSAEIMCHGSQYILQTIIQQLCLNGSTLAQPGEFTKRAFLNGKMDLSQAEAVADLIASSNSANHRIALNQMRGGISNKLKTLRTQLLEITSLLELEIDFSEEDVEFADRQHLISLTGTAKEEISQLLNSFKAGNALKNGIPVAIVGETNVGKSTLLNQLIQEDRAIVSDIKGTTRDTIEECASIQGYTFRFIDTAGIRKTDDTIESMGIERTLRKVSEASIIIMMKEPGVPYPDIHLSDHQTIIQIENKTDQFQALTGKGLDQLKHQLVTTAHKLTQCESDVIITNLRHIEALRRAEEAIERTLTSINSQLTSDLIALNLRDTINHLSEITGDITSDDTLHNIFQHFCIGK